MINVAESQVSGISRLSSDEIKKHEGKFVAIVDGHVKYADKNAANVIKWVMNCKSPDKVFSSIPKSTVSLVK